MDAALQEQPLFSRQALIRLLIPLFIEQLLAMTIGMADTIMVTSVGEHAVSGVSLVDSISVLIINIFTALSTGGAVVAAQYLGSRDLPNAQASAKQLVYTVTGLALVMMTFCLAFRAFLLRFIFGALAPDIMEAAMVYFLLTALSYPFLALYNAGAALFRAMGNSKISMLASLLMNLVNIGLNAVLIYGAKIGVAGAGFGTLFSRIAGAVFMTWLICQPHNTIYIQRLFVPEFNGFLVKKILRIGVPNGLENGMFQVGKLLVLGLVTPMGKAATAANAICNSVGAFINVPGQAVGLSLITVVGQCMGAKQPKQAVRYTRRLLALLYVSMGSLCVALFIGVHPVVALFNLSPEAAAISVDLLRLFALFTIVVWPTSFTLPHALRASGDARFTMVVAVLSMWICRVGMSYLLVLGLGLGLQGVWLAMYADWIARSVCFIIRFLGGKWKTKQVI